METKKTTFETRGYILSSNTMFGRYGYSEALKTVLLGVLPGDVATVRLGESCGGALWTSRCKELKYLNDKKGNTRGFVTIVRRNGEIMGKQIYKITDGKTLYDDCEEITDYVYKYDYDLHKNVYVEVAK